MRWELGAGAAAACCEGGVFDEVLWHLGAACLRGQPVPAPPGYPAAKREQRQEVPLLSSQPTLVFSYEISTNEQTEIYRTDEWEFTSVFGTFAD